MWDFIHINETFFGIYLILMGAYYLLYSIEYYRITIGLCTIQTFTYLSLVLLFKLLIKEDYSLINFGWLSIIFGIAVGGPISYIIGNNHQKISDILLSSWGGVTLWLLIYTLLCELFESIEIPHLVNYIIIIAFASVFGLMSHKERTIFCIISTSINGSYQLGKGIC